jgi:hypothetical protein
LALFKALVSYITSKAFGGMSRKSGSAKNDKKMESYVYERRAAGIPVISEGKRHTVGNGTRMQREMTLGLGILKHSEF